MADFTAWLKSIFSDARMNRCTNIPNTGTYLAALNKALHGILICTADGGGLTKDHVYCCNAAGNGLIDLNAIIDHNHYGPGDGGFYMDFPSEIFHLYLIKPTDWLKANWTQTVTSTGTIEDGADGSGKRYIRLRPNATSGASATIAYPAALSTTFGTYPVRLNFNYQVETASSLAFHVGVNADDITAADSNNRKIQAEVCTATNNNLWLRTANGSANSASDSGIAISTSENGIGIKNYGYLATPEADLFDPDSTLLQKTTNIAVDGSSSTGNSIKFSVKNSTGADRPLRAYLARLDFATSANYGYI